MAALIISPMTGAASATRPVINPAARFVRANQSLSLSNSASVDESRDATHQGNELHKAKADQQR
jgi:hypothetical protein